MLKALGGLKETADPSNLTPSFSFWPMKQPNQKEAAEGSGGGVPSSSRSSLGKKGSAGRNLWSPDGTMASGWGHLRYWDERSFLLQKS